MPGCRTEPLCTEVVPGCAGAGLGVGLTFFSGVVGLGVPELPAAVVAVPELPGNGELWSAVSSAGVPERLASCAASPNSDPPPESPTAGEL